MSFRAAPRLKQRLEKTAKATGVLALLRGIESLEAELEGRKR